MSSEEIEKKENENEIIEIEDEVEYNSSVRLIERDEVEMLPVYQYVLIYLFILCLFVLLTIYTIFKYKEEESEEIFYKKLFIYLTIVALSWINGKFLRGYLGWKVNYTRKVSHIFVWMIPFVADLVINVEESNLSIMWNIFMGIFGQALWMIPSRKLDCTGFLDTAFSGIDRPEDRPNTLKWLAVQNIGVGLSVLPFGILWNYWGTSRFILIPLMIVTFGDGLAEPVGVKFGKHKYKVRALCTNGEVEYTRSLEGSAMVFFASVIILGILHHHFVLYEFIINMVLVPIVATLAEAFSPHTLDNPIIIVSISILLSLIHLGQKV